MTRKGLLMLNALVILAGGATVLRAQEGDGKTQCGAVIDNSMGCPSTNADCNFLCDGWSDVTSTCSGHETKCWGNR